MAVRSKRLWGPTVVGLVDVVLYTAPAGETPVLKHLSIVNNAALSGEFILKVNGTTNSAAIYRNNVTSTGNAQLVNAFMVLQPGDVVRGISSVASMVCSAYGAELEGVAD